MAAPATLCNGNALLHCNMMTPRGAVKDYCAVQQNPT
jgi:hypothetical protein